MINAEHPDVVSVFLNQGKKLHTTHTWDFMRLEKGGVIRPSSLWRKARFGQDIIIGNLDTGKLKHDFVCLIVCLFLGIGDLFSKSLSLFGFIS